MFGMDSLKTVARYGYAKENQQAKKSTIEGALITIENSTGHIVAMVGGSDFKTKQYNRATDAQVMPGSTIKPLYYSAAISSRKYTPSTRLYDGPIVFFDELGRKFTPMHFLGTWDGSVLLRNALARSMNVPSLQVLQGIGFDTAIDRISRLLGMEDKKNDTRLFPRSYPLGLGITAVSPMKMARAFSTFANQGRAADPFGILSVQDRSGNIVLEPEKERIRNLQRTGGKDKQIMTPQEAYVMTSMLESTIEYGTLRSSTRSREGVFADMDLAGKTGTTDNWGDAWTVGFSPYYTTAIWFGFDTPGNSLGREFTGATIAGPVWAKYMQRIHEGLKPKHFEKPESGLVIQRVCRVSGLLPTENCDDGTVDEIFLAGTEPKQFCNIHEFENTRNEEITKKIENTLMIEDFSLDTLDFPELSKPEGMDSDTTFGGSQNLSNPLLD
jgi:penicillin-binding protein 1A